MTIVLSGCDLSRNNGIIIVLKYKKEKQTSYWLVLQNIVSVNYHDKTRTIITEIKSHSPVSSNHDWRYIDKNIASISPSVMFLPDNILSDFESS